MRCGWDDTCAAGRCHKGRRVTCGGRLTSVLPLLLLSDDMAETGYVQDVGRFGMGRPFLCLAVLLGIRAAGTFAVSR